MINKNTIVLGIESSCDDTSAAVIQNEAILSNVIATQDIHKKYGGVVPELASRAHQQNIVPVVHAALLEAGKTLDDLDAIAFTRGPGLMGSLVVGTAFAKALALSKNIPLIDVNHLQAHILAHFIDKNDGNKPEFPFLNLTVSGGHTQLVLVKDYFEMQLLGTTIDDAAGEAFDKIGKILGLEYPAGILIDKLAKNGNKDAFTFAKPKVDDYNYSFSGLKTSVLYFIQKQEKLNPRFCEENLSDLCASVQFTIVETLLTKVRLAIKNFPCKDLSISGGVAANSALRQDIIKLGEENNLRIHIPEQQFCTDNAAMIAIAGKLMFERGMLATQEISANARLKIGV